METMKSSALRHLWYEGAAKHRIYGTCVFHTLAHLETALLASNKLPVTLDHRGHATKFNFSKMCDQIFSHCTVISLRFAKDLLAEMSICFSYFARERKLETSVRKRPRRPNLDPVERCHYSDLLTNLPTYSKAIRLCYFCALTRGISQAETNSRTSSPRLHGHLCLIVQRSHHA